MHSPAAEFHIRPYLDADLEQVIQLWETVFPGYPPWNVPAHDIRRKLAVQRDLFLVGQRNDQIVATAMAGFDGHRGWIHRLAVAPKHRRLGLARAIMAEVETRLRAFGCVKVNLQVLSSNRDVAAFYERIGYSVEDRLSLGKLLDAPPPDVASPPEEASVKIAVNDTLHLSKLRPGDKAACMAFLNNIDIHNATLRIPHPYTESSFDEFMPIVAEQTAKYGHPVHFAVRNENDCLIGGCAFDGLTTGHRAEIGYWLAKPFWGQGIMTDVVGAACEFAFAKWKLVRITAYVFAFNVASARVLEKNGFQREGFLKKHYMKKGTYADALLYALTR